MELKVFETPDEFAQYASTLLKFFKEDASTGQYADDIGGFVRYFYQRHWTSGSTTYSFDGGIYDKDSLILYTEWDDRIIPAEAIYLNYRPCDQVKPSYRIYLRISRQELRRYFRRWYKWPVHRSHLTQIAQVDEAASELAAEAVHLSHRGRVKKLRQRVDLEMPRTRQARRSWKHRTKARKQWAQAKPKENFPHE